MVVVPTLQCLALSTSFHLPTNSEKDILLRTLFCSRRNQMSSNLSILLLRGRAKSSSRSCGPTKHLLATGSAGGKTGFGYEISQIVKS